MWGSVPLTPWFLQTVHLHSFETDFKCTYTEVNPKGPPPLEVLFLWSKSPYPFSRSFISPFSYLFLIYFYTHPPCLHHLSCWFPHSIFILIFPPPVYSNYHARFPILFSYWFLHPISYLWHLFLSHSPHFIYTPSQHSPYLFSRFFKPAFSLSISPAPQVSILPIYLVTASSLHSQLSLYLNT